MILFNETESSNINLLETLSLSIIFIISESQENKFKPWFSSKHLPRSVMNLFWEQSSRKVSSSGKVD